jgi:hypothetical protein
MQHLEGISTPVLYIGRTVLKRLSLSQRPGTLVWIVVRTVLEILDCV